MNQKVKNIIIVTVIAVVLIDLAVAFAFALELSKGDGEGTTTTGEILDGPDYSELVLSEHVTLGQYKGLTLFADSYLATNAEINEAIEELRVAYIGEDSYEKYEPAVTDRATAKFEQVGIDYDWYVDGKLIASEKDKIVVLTEASSIYPEGFATQLTGVKPGTTKTLNLIFADDRYLNGPYAGKAVTFIVTVKDIQGKYTPPEFNDEFIQMASNGNYKTAASYIEFLKDYIEGEKKQGVDESNSDTMWASIARSSKVIKYPDEQVNYYFNKSVEEYKKLASEAGLSYEEFLEYMGVDEEYIMRDAKASVKKDLVYRAILEAEDITLTEEDYENAIEKYMDYYQMSREDLFLEYTEDDIRASALWDKLMEHLLKNQKFVVVENGVEYEEIDVSKLDFSTYITLGKYKDLSVDTRSDEYTDEELEADLKKFLESKAEYDKFDAMITDTSIITARGDVLNIDFVGYVNGKTFEGGSAKGQEIKLMIESGYIDGFAEGLYGKNIGEKVSITVKFPEDYSAVELRGVTATFDVTINGIVGRYYIKELTDEYAKELSKNEIETAEEYIEDFRQRKAKSKVSVVKGERYRAVVAAIKEHTTVLSYPEEQVMYYYASDFRYYESNAAAYMVDLDTFLSANGMSRASLYENAQDHALDDIILQNIIKVENITLADGDYDRALAALEEDTGMTEEEIIESNGEGFIESYALRLKLIDFLFENTNFVEK